MVMPDSGFFMEWYQNNNGLSYGNGMEWVYNYQNTSIALNNQCKSNYTSSGLPEWKCMFAQNLSPFINVKSFVIQSMFDSWQQGCESNAPNDAFENEYGQLLVNNFTTKYINADGDKQIGDKHGAFLDSCSHHCSGGTEGGVWNTIIIDNVNVSVAQFNWYYGKTQTDKRLYNQNEKYPCKKCCNNS